MERQREGPKEKIQEEKEKELVELRKELERLRELKRQRELKEKKAAEEQVDEEQVVEEKIEEIESVAEELKNLEEIEERLTKIDDFLTKQLEQTDQKTYEQHAEQIEAELQELEAEIVGEKGLIQKEITTYERLLQDYPWLEEERKDYMYDFKAVSKNKSDLEEWKEEWAKVLFDYAKYAILHILYLRQLYTEKPFSNILNHQTAVKEIAQELIDQNLAKWLSKKKEKLRVYWKTLEVWAEDIYNWAYELGNIEPIMVFEIREADLEFSNLPKEDLEEVFKILVKDDRAKILKLDNGEISIKIKIE